MEILQSNKTLKKTRGGMGERKVLKQARGTCMLCFTYDLRFSGIVHEIVNQVQKSSYSWKVVDRDIDFNYLQFR